MEFVTYCYIKTFERDKMSLSKVVFLQYVTDATDVVIYN